MDTMNLDFSEKGEKLQKIIGVYNAKMEESFGQEMDIKDDLRT